MVLGWRKDAIDGAVDKVVGLAGGGKVVGIKSGGDAMRECGRSCN